MNAIPTASLATVATPAVVVDLAQVRANVAAMASHLESRGIALRPHVKTHKCPEIVDLQQAAGASGFTAATVREAEMLVAHGARDILVAYPPIGAWREQRLLPLIERAKLTFAVDSPQAAAAVGRLGRAAGRDVGLLWEVDPGTGRCGTPPGRPSVEPAMEAAEIDGIAFAGFFAFAGHVYAARDLAELHRIARDEESALERTASEAEKAGLLCAVLSAGTTPTAVAARAESAVTEYRPGNYVFYDATQIALEVATIEQCALKVLATVVARPDATRLVIDAGSKALGKETMTPRTRGYGIVVGHPEIQVSILFEEHAVLASQRGHGISIGDRIEIIPNHACVTANLHDSMLFRSGPNELRYVPVMARGWAVSRSPDDEAT